MTGTRKRRYRLSPGGLRSLRATIRRVRPWRKSTGPSTLEGRVQSSRNALKHGRRTTHKAPHQAEHYERAIADAAGHAAV